MKKIMIGLLYCGIPLLAASTPLHVDLNIYTNKAFLTKQFELKTQGYITTKIPTFLNLTDIRYQIPESCEVDNTVLSNNKKIVNNELEKFINLKSNLTYEVEAIFAKNKLLKTLSLKNQSDLSKIDETSEFLSQHLVENFKEIDKLKKYILSLDKKIKNTNTLLSEFKELTITYTCKQENKILSINYPQQKIKNNSFYNINANINNKSVTIEKKANIFYKGVESLPQVDINIYSYGFNQSVAPRPFYPKYLGGKEVIAYSKMATMAVMGKTPRKVKQSKAVHQNLKTKSMYKIKDTKLLTSQYNLFTVDKKLINADFKTVIDAYGTNKAYLEATIKTKKDYQGSMAKYFLNSNPISSRHINKIQKDKETKLYFGEDEHIQIKKNLVKTLDEKTFFGDKKISTQNWEYTITNKKPYTTKISFQERVPVSKDGDIKVQLLTQPKADFQNAEGLLRWDFTLEPNKDKKIIFGYEVSNNK